MPDIHADPEKLLAAVQQHRDNSLKSLTGQLGHYEDARDLVRGADDEWFGGHGGTGRLPAVSRSFLTWLGSKIEAQIAEQKALKESLERYLSGLTELANNLQAAEDENARSFDSLAQFVAEGKQ